MAQIAAVISGDPYKTASDITTLAISNTIQIITKTYSSGKFVVLYDNSASVSQSCDVVTGDPDTIKDKIQVLIDNGKTIDIVHKTFSASHYLVVYK